MTKKQLLEYAKEQTAIRGEPPIYEIMVFENPNTEQIGSNGKTCGIPDLGESAFMGFYYRLEDAIMAMYRNHAYMYQDRYLAGFVLCKFPGMEGAAGSEARMYFLWDDEQHGFLPKEEPAIFMQMEY